MFDDISFLVQETLKEAGIFNDEALKKEVPTDCAGVLVNVEIKVSTFVIRIKACEDLAHEFDKATLNPELYPSLRLSKESKLSFFACDNLQIAKLIKERFANKRFPINEEHIFNVSDPGDSWWLAQNGKELSINFKLSQTHNISELIKLGPLGEATASVKMFGALSGYFQLLFPVLDYSTSSSQVVMTSKAANDPIFEGFKKLLIDGEADYEFWEKLRALEVEHAGANFIESLKKANHFLLELSTLRTFWSEVQLELSSLAATNPETIN